MKRSWEWWLGWVAIASMAIILVTSCEKMDDDLPDPGNQNVGDTLWIQDIGSDSSFISGGSMALSPDGKTCYYAEAGGTLYWTPATIVARSTSDGTRIWRSERLDHIGISSQIIVGDNGTIYVTGFHNLYAIAPSDGRTMWKWEVPTELPNPDNPQTKVYTYGQIGSMALTDEGSLILGSIGSGSYSRGVYCISASGELLWHNLKANGTSIVSGISVGKNDMAFFYTDINQAPNDLVAINTINGAIIWTTDVLNIGSSYNNILIDEDGTLLCTFKKDGDTERRLHKVDPVNGEILWSSESTAEFGRKLMDKNGRVFQWFQFEGGMNIFEMPNGTRQQFSQQFNAQFVGAINDKNQAMATNSLSGRTRLAAYDEDGTIDWDVEINGMANFPMLILDNGTIIGIINEHPSSFIPRKIVAIKGDSRLAREGWPRYAHDNQNTSNVNN